ncbi:MAG: sigma-54 dependent transcriptional regulator [Lentisphaerota bacterium]
MTTPRVLIIEDDPDGLKSVQEAIADLGFETRTAETGREGVRKFLEEEFDAVLSDLVLPDIDGIEVLNRIRKNSEQVPVIIMTAYGSVPSSVKALKSGAYDYIPKPLDLEDLQSKITRAVETSGLRTRVTQLNRSLHEKYAASAMVAESPAMKEVLRQIEALAGTMATVLIQGESGTGKELVARALHVEGRRSDGPFIAVNCGAFSQNLLESELFGHEKGSFTGATQQHKGAFERADGGTLFLDEIGDAPKSVQVKLLRVLEEREIIRVGGQVSFKVDVRLISATNKDLDEMVEAGEFRQDLLYRLKVVTLEIPPLRVRREDIRALADRFIASACQDHGRSISWVEPEYYQKLQQYDWPGNVRQLRNVAESSVIMAVDRVLKGASLRLEGPVDSSAGPFVAPEGMTLAEMEKEILTQLLKKYEGNRSLTADKLGISRRTIQRKIKDYQLPY